MDPAGPGAEHAEIVVRQPVTLWPRSVTRRQRPSAGVSTSLGRPTWVSRTGSGRRWHTRDQMIRPLRSCGRSCSCGSCAKRCAMRCRIGPGQSEEKPSGTALEPLGGGHGTNSACDGRTPPHRPGGIGPARLVSRVVGSHPAAVRVRARRLADIVGPDRHPARRTPAARRRRRLRPLHPEVAVRQLRRGGRTDPRRHRGHRRPASPVGVGVPHPVAADVGGAGQRHGRRPDHGVQPVHVAVLPRTLDAAVTRRRGQGPGDGRRRGRNPAGHLDAAEPRKPLLPRRDAGRRPPQVAPAGDGRAGRRRP